MKRTVLKFLAFATVFVFVSSCITTKLPDDFTVEPMVLENHGGKVNVTVSATIPEKSFGKKDIVEFTPFVRYKDGKKELKTVTLLGEKALGEGIVINSKTGGKISYSDVFDFEDDMLVSELVVIPMLRKKGGTPVEMMEYKLADGIINTSQMVYHDENLYHADRETAKMLNMDVSEYYELETIIAESAVIYFLVNKHNLNWNVPLNKDEKAKELLKGFKEFLAQGWKIKDLAINAWASPEGEESFNEGLSERRSVTGEKYIYDLFKKLLKSEESKCKIKDPATEVKINTSFHGEDWDGFLTAVERSNLKDKNAILNVVRSQQNVTKREEEIRNMSLVYKEIADNILPGLRRVVYKVNCFEPKRTAEEIAELAVTTPDVLTDKELLYAGTLTDDLDTKLQIYKSYMTLYPGDWKGYNNAAWVQLNNWELEEAATLLAKADELSSNNPMVKNNLGALASKEKDYVMAGDFYGEAKKLGAPVNYNMGIINIINGDYNKALNLLGDKDCNYNVALAKMLSGNTSGAISNLDCDEECPMYYYLRAILGSRTDNSRMLYDNLAKAIEKKEKIKGYASEDREFFNYFGETEFQNLVK